MDQSAPRKGSPLTDDGRRVIADAVRAGGTRNDVARRFDRSTGVITRIAEADGL